MRLEVYVWALIALSATSLAGGMGGGGLMVHQDSALSSSSADEPILSANPFDSCAGMTGFGVTDQGTRMGAEGHACAGPNSGMGFGGLQAGWLAKQGPFYGTFYSSFGGGGIAVNDPTLGDYKAVFAYVRPRLAMGFALVFVAMDIGPYITLPLPLYQTVDEEMVGGHLPVQSGIELSFLFGDFQASI